MTNIAFLEQLAERLSAIASGICGSAHAELNDEVRLIRDVIRREMEPLKQALPAGFQKRRGK